MRRVIGTLFIIILSGYIGYALGVSKISLDWGNYKPEFSILSKEPPKTLHTVDFSLFWNVWGRLADSYYDKSKLDPQKLLQGAVIGLVEGVEDPYTIFLPRSQNSDFKQGLAGEFEGIGAELGMKDKQIIVVAPLDGSPAKRAGIQAGDAIFKVNEDSTAGWTLAQAVEKIRGPRETKVRLTIAHKDEQKTSEITVVRDKIIVKSVDGWVKKIKDIEGVQSSTLRQGSGQEFKVQSDANIGYIRLSQFGDTANKDWLSVTNTLALEIKQKNAKGLILDLRNNPGGYLPGAQFIAGEFLERGRVVVIQEKGNGERTALSVDRDGLLKDVKLIVLINKGSASASEIVVGALKDHRRALIVGEASFGKGTIQSAEDLGNGVGLHITIAKWLTPNGTWIHEKGIAPDVEVKLDEKDPSHDKQLEKAVEELVK